MRYIFTWSLVGILLAGCTSDEPTASLQVYFENVVGTDALTLDTQTYTNAAGEAFQVKLFKYHISHIELMRSDGKTISIPESYYLIDEATPESKRFTLSGIPAGEYNALRFMVGIDSARNVSGAQTGALDPLHGMFWSWKTGYIFVKLEGTSPASTETENRFQYHIGGFANPNNIRYVSPVLPQKLVINENSTASIRYKADIARLLGGVNVIKIAEQPSIMFDKSSAKLADNYSQMFSVVEVKSY